MDLALVPGTARKGRITREDVQKFVKASLSGGTAAGVPLAGVAVAAPLEIDFSKWGETRLEPLNRVRRISSANLHRSWVTVPHVTQFDEADITELDAFRAAQKEEAAREIRDREAKGFPVDGARRPESIRMSPDFATIVAVALDAAGDPSAVDAAVSDLSLTVNAVVTPLLNASLRPPEISASSRAR